MMNAKDQVWKTEALGKRYLEGIRGAIPFAEQQIELTLQRHFRANDHG